MTLSQSIELVNFSFPLTGFKLGHGDSSLDSMNAVIGTGNISSHCGIMKQYIRCSLLAATEGDLLQGVRSVTWPGEGATSRLALSRKRNCVSKGARERTYTYTHTHNHNHTEECNSHSYMHTHILCIVLDCIINMKHRETKQQVEISYLAIFE